MGFLTDEEIAELRPAQDTMFPSPIPTRVVSSDEFAPIPQTAGQREVEARIKSMADEIGAKQNLPRRRFLSTTSGVPSSPSSAKASFFLLMCVGKRTAFKPLGFRAPVVGRYLGSNSPICASLHSPLRRIRLCRRRSNVVIWLENEK